MTPAPLVLSSSKALSNEECPRIVRLRRRDGGSYLSLPCASRRCRVCGPRVWMHQLSRQFFDGFRGYPLDVFKRLTLTAPGATRLHSDLSIRDWNFEAPKYRMAFFRLLRGRYAEEPIDYWWVAELQQRGAIHYHVVLRGLRWISIKVLNDIGPRSGFGNAHLDRRRGDRIDPRSTWTYFTKEYFTKAVLSWDRPAHVTGCSPGWSQAFRRRRGRSQFSWDRVPESVWWFEEGRALTVGMLGGAGEPVSGAIEPLSVDRVPF
jgi:hypothetical protein